MRKITFFTLLVLCGFLVACGRTATPGTPQVTLTATSATPSAATAVMVPVTPEPTVTDQQDIGLVYAPADSTPWLLAAVENSLSAYPGEPGISWETRTTLTASELSDKVRLVIALAPGPDLEALIASAPETQFLAIGITGLTPADNLIRIGLDGFRPDRQAFIAGYLAAVITEDWRVGVLSPGDTPAGRAARQGFLNGARFFCGLCLPEVPPYAGYPLFVDLQRGADQATWQAAADLLLAGGVKTLYLEPSIDQLPLREYLAENGVILIGGGIGSSQPVTQWAATVRADVQRALEEAWSGVLPEKIENSIELSYVLEDINESLVSPGRQRLVEALIPDLVTGLIDTGVDPLTGEVR